MKAVVNIVTRRPACVLIQAAVVGDEGLRVANLFRSEHWELAPCSDHRIIDGTLDQWRKLSASLDQERQANEM